MSTALPARLSAEIVRWAASLGRPLEETDVEALAERIAPALAGVAITGDIEPRACQVCEEVVSETADCRGVACCPPCELRLRHALEQRELGRPTRVLRSRCVGVIERGCGSIYAVRIVAGNGAIVDETSGVCPACRPAQERLVRLIGREDGADAR